MANVVRQDQPVDQATDGDHTVRTTAAKRVPKGSAKSGAKGNGQRRPVVAREIESKFDIGDGFALPDLAGLPGVAGLAAPQEQSLDATYFDTPDLRLLTRGVTLRRRTGGSDAGWHLKLPKTASGGTSEREELRLPPGRSARTVPPALAEQVSSFTGGEPLAPVVRLRTRRIARPVLAPDGRVVAEIAQDDVSASAPNGNGSPASVTAWSEVEVELVAGKRATLAAITERMLRAGATPSAAPSKLARALADRLDHLSTSPAAPSTGPAAQVAPVRLPKGSAGAIVLAHLGEHVGRLKANEPLVRADRPDAVHQMRVATRRLRSALATFRPLFDRTVTDPLRQELQWLAEVLGAARDAEVIRDHLATLVRAEPDDLISGPVQARITTTLDARYRHAHDAVLTELDGTRYHRLLDHLDDFLARPPLSKTATRKADTVLLPLATKTWTTMQRLHQKASTLQPTHLPLSHARALDQDLDIALHDLRKAAKRARYAGEALAARYGKPAKTWAARMEAIQETLGAHQDTVVIRAQLRDLALTAHADGEDTFTYGRLHALEQARADTTTRDYRPDYRRAAKPRQHRWLHP